MDGVYKRIALCGDVYFEHPRFLREFVFKLKEKYGYRLKLYTRGNRYGAEKWIKKYALYFEIDYWEFNPAYTRRTPFSFMPLYYFRGKKYNVTQLYHINGLIQKHTDELVYFDSGKEREKQDQNLINEFQKKANKKVIIIDK